MFEQKTDSKAALFMADGLEEVEALGTADVLFRAGIPVTTVAVKEEPLIRSSHDVTILTDLTISELRFEDYDMLILPGGMPGTANLASHALLKEKVLQFAEEGKMLAAICAAPSILADLGILKGKRATSHPSVTDKLISGGADVCEESVVKDGNIITSRGLGTVLDFGLAIVTHYFDEDTAEALAKTFVYRT